MFRRPLRLSGGGRWGVEIGVGGASTDTYVSSKTGEYASSRTCSSTMTFCHSWSSMMGDEEAEG